MKPNFEGLDTLTSEALQIKLQHIMVQLQNYEENSRRNKDLSIPVDLDCKLLIERMLKDTTYKIYEDDLENILQLTERILAKDKQKTVLKSISGFSHSVLQQRPTPVKPKNTGEQFGYNTSLLDMVYPKDDDQIVNPDFVDPITSMKSSVTQSETRSPHPNTPPQLEQEEARPELSHAFNQFVADTAGQLITARRLGISGTKSEAQIKKSITDELTSLMSFENKDTSSTIRKLNDALDQYIKYLESEEDVDSIFSDNTDNVKEDTSDTSVSYLFSQRVSLFIQGLQRASSTNSRFDIEINAFVKDTQDSLNIKFIAHPPRQAVQVPTGFAALFGKARISPESSHSSSPVQSERSDDTINKPIPKKTPNVTGAAGFKPAPSVVETTRSIANKARQRSAKKTPSFPTTKKVVIESFELPRTKRYLDQAQYNLKNDELVALKNRIKECFDVNHSIVTTDEANQAKALIADYRYKLSALNNAPLSDKQRKNMQSHATLEFISQVTLWDAKVDGIIKKNQAKERAQESQPKVKRKLAIAFKHAANKVLESDASNIHESLIAYNVHKKALLSVLKKDKKQGLIDLLQRVNTHINEVKEQSSTPGKISVAKPAVSEVTHVEIPNATTEEVSYELSSEDDETHRDEVPIVSERDTSLEGGITENAQIDTNQTDSPRAQKLDDATVQKIIDQSESLAKEFNKKIQQLYTSPKLIQYNTPTESFTKVVTAAVKMQANLELARQKFKTSGDLSQYQQECSIAFSDMETMNEFNTNRTSPWLRPLTALFEDLKRRINSLIESPRFANATGSFFNPFKIGTETAQKAEEYQQNLNSVINKKGGD